MKEMTANQLKEKLDAAEHVNLIDVREEEEIATGKIPGAKHIPLGSFVNEFNTLDQDASYVIICRSGGRSAMACQLMSLNGYDACNVVDGMVGWTGDIE